IAGTPYAVEMVAGAAQINTLYSAHVDSQDAYVGADFGAPGTPCATAWTKIVGGQVEFVPAGVHESTATNPRLTPVAGGLEVHAPQVGLVGNVTASGTFAATGKSTLADVDAGDTMVAGTLETTGASTLAAVTATGLTVNGAASVTGSDTLGATTADSLTVTGGPTLAATTATSLTVNGNEVGTDTGWVELTPATGWTKS